MGDISAPSDAGTGQAADGVTGRVLEVVPGAAVVRLALGPVRASFGGALLCRIAQDPEEAPRVGDRVLVRRWPDGPMTVERVVARAVR